MSINYKSQKNDPFLINRQDLLIEPFAGDIRDISIPSNEAIRVKVLIRICRWSTLSSTIKFNVTFMAKNINIWTSNYD